MTSLTFSKEKEAPSDLLQRSSVSEGKYIDLIKFIEKEAVVGEWIKVSIEEENADSLKKAIHSMQTTVRSWKKNVLKKGKYFIELSQYRKMISSTKAEVWIRIDRYDKS